MSHLAIKFANLLVAASEIEKAAIANAIQNWASLQFSLAFHLTIVAKSTLNMQLTSDLSIGENRKAYHCISDTGHALQSELNCSKWHNWFEPDSICLLVECNFLCNFFGTLFFKQNNLLKANCQPNTCTKSNKNPVTKL